MNPLIKELRDGIEEAVDILVNDRALTAEQKVAIMSDVIRAEFNKYPVAAEPKEEGFVEGYINCQCGAASAYKNIHGVICCGNCDKPLDRHPAKAEEPKDCGFTLATCPYERCSGITMRNPRATEPLAVLMKKKDYSDMRVNVENKHYKWSIEFRGYSPYKEITGDTYPSCEAKARAFLMGLPDKGETK